jgi:ABC-type Fe3+-siderophore transport system permease subunit
VLALVLLQAASRAGLVDPQALGVSLVACTLVWTATQVSLLGRREINR